MAAIATGEHAPQRPAWICACCGQDWPCSPARVQLGEQYGAQRVNLAVQMFVQLGYAVSELTTVTPAQLFERFIAWTR